MSFHSETSSIRRYINDCYPQFIAPIEAVQWSNWETDDDIPDGKNSIWISLYTLSMTLSNLDNDYSTQEVDFLRDIQQIFEEVDEDVNNLSSEKLLKVYKDSFDRNRHLYEEIKLPI